MPATDFRQIIVEKFKTAMALIHVAGGYYTELGSKVTEGKVNPYGDNRVDGVDVIDRSDETEDITEARELEDHKLIIEVKTIAKNPLTPEVARKQIADVRKAVKTLFSDSWCAQNLDALYHIRNDFEIEQAGEKIIGTRTEFGVEFRTDKLSEA